MPYLGGETLRSRLQRQGRLDRAEAIGLLRDLADALAYAHRAGVVHRDLKPENVLCAGGRALLMDFGIARLASLGKRTAAGVILGTPGYMAPEQQNGRTVDHRADLWAWGGLAREMLLGERDAGRTLATDGEVPGWLATLVEQCLAQDPEARPASAEVLLQVLSTLPEV
jgi:serine/threonine-protein kinase